MLARNPFLTVMDDASFKKQLATFMARRMALFEICSHPAQVAPGYGGVPGKIGALDRLLEELISAQGEKVVLWSLFRYSLQELCRRYERFNPVRLDGTVTDAEARAEAITRFQEDDKTMLFIANLAAGGAGITLTKSRVAVYESFPIQSAHYLQSVDRIHRRGQTREVHYYVLLCRDSIEEDESERPAAKEAVSAIFLASPCPSLYPESFSWTNYCRRSTNHRRTGMSEADKDLQRQRDGQGSDPCQRPHAACESAAFGLEG